MNAEPEERGMLALARAGDGDALSDLYRRYGQEMLDMAYHVTGSGDDAEDVLQDVFVGLPDALRSYGGSGDLVSWLRRLTARAALMRMRRERRANRLQQQAALEQPAATHQPSVAARLVLERLLGRMPGQLRAVYVLKEMEGYSHADIAELLGITVAASEVRLYRARGFLRARLKGRQ